MTSSAHLLTSILKSIKPIDSKDSFSMSQCNQANKIKERNICGDINIRSNNPMKCYGTYTKVNNMKNDFLIKNMSIKENLNSEILKNPLLSPRFKDKLSELISSTPSTKIKLVKNNDIAGYGSSLFRNRKKELLSMINLEEKKENNLSPSSRKVKEIERLLNKKPTTQLNMYINSYYNSVSNKTKKENKKSIEEEELKKYEKDFSVNIVNENTKKKMPRHQKNKSEVIFNRKGQNFL